MSENQQPQTPSDPTDPLASLHRMSTTAGLGSQEYVAINLVAVMTLVLGFASALVLLSPLLLVIPVVALVCGIVAIRQISQSNGTQTGKGLAWLGVLLSVGLAGFIGVRAVQAEQANKAAEQAINARIDGLGKTLIAEDYQKARDYFSDRFLARKDITNDVFTSRMKLLSSNPQFGKMVSLTTNGRLQVLSGTDAQAAQVADTMLVAKFEKAPQPLRQGIRLRKQGDLWKIDDMPTVFPPVDETKAEGRPNVPG